jgi:hypothetical protein
MKIVCFGNRDAIYFRSQPIIVSSFPSGTFLICKNRCPSFSRHWCPRVGASTRRVERAEPPPAARVVVPLCPCPPPPQSVNPREISGTPFGVQLTLCTCIRWSAPDDHRLPSSNSSSWTTASSKIANGGIPLYGSGTQAVRVNRLGPSPTRLKHVICTPPSQDPKERKSHILNALALA